MDDDEPEGGPSYLCPDCRTPVGPDEDVCADCGCEFETGDFECMICGTTVAPETSSCPACGTEFIDPAQALLRVPLRTLGGAPEDRRAMRKAYFHGELKDDADE